MRKRQDIEGGTGEDTLGRAVLADEENALNAWIKGVASVIGLHLIDVNDFLALTTVVRQVHSLTR